MNRPFFIALCAVAFLGCVRGVPTDKPPIHPIQDMFNQPRYNPQAQSDFFPDSAAMRTPVAGTLAQGELRDDSAFFWGMENGNFISASPIPVTPGLLKRGRERFDIYCSPCHSRLGDGKGIVVQRGYAPPISFHTDLVRQYSDGQIFSIMSVGMGAMPSYGAQVKVSDRWAIVSYIRALQLSQNATLNDVPPEMKSNLR